MTKKPRQKKKSKEKFPGDTIVVSDPPATSTSTTDSFGVEKGLAAPPGARGEYFENRPPGGGGLSGNSGLPIDPIKTVAYTIAPIPEHDDKNHDSSLLLYIDGELQKRYNTLYVRVLNFIAQTHIHNLDIFDFPSVAEILALPTYKKLAKEQLQQIVPNYKTVDFWTLLFSDDQIRGKVITHLLYGIPEEKIIPHVKKLYKKFKKENPTVVFSIWLTQPDTPLDNTIYNVFANILLKQPEKQEYVFNWWRVHPENTKIRKVAKYRAYLHILNLIKKKLFLNYIKSEYVTPVKTLFDAMTMRVPLIDMINALCLLPFSDEDKKHIQSFKKDYYTIIEKGMHSLDLYRPPQSSLDRKYGIKKHTGMDLIPVKRIVSYHTGSLNSVNEKHAIKTQKDNLIPVYKYGDAYFLVNEEDINHIPKDAHTICARVYNIIPGSGILHSVQGQLYDRLKNSIIKKIFEDLEQGKSKEALLLKYGKEFGSGALPLIELCHSIFEQQTKMSKYHQQTSDNSEGATFNVGTGGVEFGYGGSSFLHYIFLHAPANEFSRYDPAAYDSVHHPGTPA